MQSPGDVEWRRLRGGTVALVATVLAAAGHSLGGGHLPDLTVLAPAAAGLGWVSAGLARHRLRFPMLLAMLLTAQVGFHLLFLLEPAPSMPGMAMSPTGGSSWLVMVGFHALAALVTALLLAGAEKALLAVTEPVRMMRLLVAPARLPVGVTLRSLPPVNPAIRIGPVQPARSPAPRRGPPVCGS